MADSALLIREWSQACDKHLQQAIAKQAANRQIFLTSSFLFVTEGYLIGWSYQDRFDYHLCRCSQEHLTNMVKTSMFATVFDLKQLAILTPFQVPFLG